MIVCMVTAMKTSFGDRVQRPVCHASPSSQQLARQCANPPPERPCQPQAACRGRAPRRRRSPLAATPPPRLPDKAEVAGLQVSQSSVEKTSHCSTCSVHCLQRKGQDALLTTQYSVTIPHWRKPDAGYLFTRIRTACSVKATKSTN